MSTWKNEQDSIRNWNITQGSAGIRFDWVLASYKQEKDRAQQIQKQLSSPATINRFDLLLKVTDLYESIINIQ
jgi:hypothetical protein